MPTFLPTGFTIQLKLSLLSGAPPRSDVNTNADFGSCSFCVTAKPDALPVGRVSCADVNRCGMEVDRVPSEFAYLGSPEAMPVGDEDLGGVPVAVAITFRGLDQLFDLGLG